MSPHLVVYTIIALALGAASFVVLDWKHDAAQLKKVQIEYAAYRAANETAKRINGETMKDYRNELQDLRAAARKPARTVRVCNEPVQAVPGNPAGAAGTPPAEGVLPAEPGQDIGPDLYEAADLADEVTARARAMQNWLQKVQETYKDG